MIAKFVRFLFEVAVFGILGCLFFGIVIALLTSPALLAYHFENKWFLVLYIPIIGFALRAEGRKRE